MKFTIFLTLFFCSSLVFAQPDWDYNPYDFGDNGSITAIIQLNEIAVGDTNDFLGAFVGDECRGICTGVDTQLGFFYFLTVYGDAGDILNFRYWNSLVDEIYELDEILPFEPNMIVGDIFVPFELNGYTDLVPDCNGVYGGSAFYDDCGICSGGDTGHEPNSDDLGCGCFEPAPQQFFEDQDNDNYGAGDGGLFCTDEIPESWVPNDGDCDENDSLINPAADEICDYINNDCDDETDENCLIGDIDQDNIVDVADLVIIVQFAMGLSDLNDYQMWASDLNQDEVINIFDVVLLVEEILL